MVASGTFVVVRAPLESESPLQRYSLEKEFNGDLVGTGKGAMLAWQRESDGTAAYVALEEVQGTVNGLSGSFVLAHYGRMTVESQELMLAVVAGSGTGELDGLQGSMELRIEQGAHSYEFRYELASDSLPDE